MRIKKKKKRYVVTRVRKIDLDLEMNLLSLIG